MGREIKPDLSETDKQREELRLVYRGAILDTPHSERSGAYKTVADACIRFLSGANPSSRLDAIVSEVIKRGAQQAEASRPWMPGQTAEVFRHMETYALNLWDFPWKTEFHTIKIFSGFFKIKIENKIFSPDDIFLLLGYKKVADCFQLLQMQSREEIGRVAFALFLAGLECSEMEKIHNAVKPIGIGSKLVYEVRQEVRGDARICADHVRERHRVSKSGGTGRSGSKTVQSGAHVEGGPRTERIGDVGGGGGVEQDAEVLRSRNTSCSLPGQGDLRTNKEGKDDVKSHFQTSCQSGGKLESKSVEAKMVSTGSLVPAVVEKRQMGAEIEGHVHQDTAENIYDAVEDSSQSDSVYYGFPSIEKTTQLGNLKTTKQEKKEPLASRVAAGNSIWNQSADPQANLSFSTFRQDKTKSNVGSDFRKSGCHTTDSKEIPAGQSRGALSEATLRIRGAPIAADGDQPYPSLCYGDNDRDSGGLLCTCPEQMPTRGPRRQMVAQLDQKSRGSNSSKSTGIRPEYADAYSPNYNSWQYPNQDLPPPPPESYPDLQYRRSGASAVRGSGKTRDPWGSEETDSEDTWQCGSCSYENSPIDDPCQVCGTARFL